MTQVSTRTGPACPKVVGVVRLPHPASWNNATPAIVVQERATDDVASQVAALAAEVRAGAWDAAAEGVDQRRGQRSRSDRGN